MMQNLLLKLLLNFFFGFNFAGAITSLYLVSAFIFILFKKDISIGNFTWGGGVMLLTLVSFFMRSPLDLSARKILVTVLVLCWGIRLIVYLYLRYHKGADARFTTWSQSWGVGHVFATFVWIVLLQGTLMLIMASPSVVINTQAISNPLGLLDIVGTIMWIVGFFFESVGDHQLYAFLKNPKNAGKIMDQGLWRYSRHPNYFGEIAMWWGIYFIALSAAGGFSTVIAPVTITILLVFITGIPWAEGVFKNNPAYETYKKHTNRLIPWLPKNYLN